MEPLTTSAERLIVGNGIKWNRLNNQPTMALARWHDSTHHNGTMAPAMTLERRMDQRIGVGVVVVVVVCCCLLLLLLGLASSMPGLLLSCRVKTYILIDCWHKLEPMAHQLVADSTINQGTGTMARWHDGTSW